MRAKTILLGMVGLSLVGLIILSVNQEGQRRPEMAVVAQDLSAAEQRAEKALRAEPKIKDLLFQPGQAVEWQVGVLTDGTSRVGYANYVCEVLRREGVIKPRTEVRVVDIVKVVNGTNFRSASLGHVACSDRRVIEP